MAAIKAKSAKKEEEVNNLSKQIEEGKKGSDKSTHELSMKSPSPLPSSLAFFSPLRDLGSKLLRVSWSRRSATLSVPTIS